MAIMDWMLNRLAASAGNGYSDAGPNSTGLPDSRTSLNTFAISRSTGRSTPSAKPPGHSARTFSIGTFHEAAAGSQGYTSHARSHVNTASTASSTSLIVCSRSLVPRMERFTRSMLSKNQ